MNTVPPHAIRATELVSEILTLVTTDVFEQRLSAVSGSVAFRPEPKGEGIEYRPDCFRHLGRQDDTGASE